MNSALLALLGARVAAGGGALTGEYLGVATSTASGVTSVTFPGMNFGTAAAGRVIVAGISRFGDYLLSSVTIGGVTATVAAESALSNRQAAIVYATVPSGSSGDVVVNSANFPGGCVVSLWRIDQAVQVSDVAAGDSPQTVTGVAGGFIACMGAAQNSTFTWTNATKRNGGYVDSVGYTAADSTAVGDIAVSVNLAGNRGLACVAFAPA